MRELRKQALESHKKVSRKSINKAAQSASLTASPARTPMGSRQGSTLTSPAMSRVGSRNATDSEDSSEEGSVMSDMYSTAGEMMSLDEAATWETILQDRIQEIIEWKRSTSDGREKALRQYVLILQQRYADEEISGKEQELVQSMMRSIKRAGSDMEVEMALKAIEMTAVTSGLDTMFEDCGPLIKRTVEEEDRSERIKVMGIRAYATLAFFSGLEDEGIVDVMDFLLEIIATDGDSIEAQDAPGPVAAAIQAYALLATYVDDLSDYSSEHAETLTDQLDSGVPAVQVAAGEAIALLYEKSYTAPEQDEDWAALEKSQDSNMIREGEDGPNIAPKLIRRYPASSNSFTLKETLEGLAATSGRAKNKDVKAARRSFKYILHSIEHPLHGPMYSDNFNQDGQKLGSRFKIKVGKTSVIAIDKWWKYARVISLRHCLQSGFLTHYDHNPLLRQMMPVSVEQYREKNRK